MNKIIDFAAHANKMPPVTLVINPSLVDQLFSGQKVAVMAQGSFNLGQKIVFESTQGNDTVKIASAVIIAIAALRITPEIEQIEVKQGLFFKTLKPDQTNNVLRAEGIKVPDQFWHYITQMSKNKPFETYQVYFEDVKIFEA